MSNEEVDTREDNLLENRGCEIQTARTITPLLPEAAELESLVNRMIPCIPVRQRGIFIN